MLLSWLCPVCPVSLSYSRHLGQGDGWVLLWMHVVCLSQFVLSSYWCTCKVNESKMIGFTAVILKCFGYVQMHVVVDVCDVRVCDWGGCFEIMQASLLFCVQFGHYSLSMWSWLTRPEGGMAELTHGTRCTLCASAFNPHRDPGMFICIFHFFDWGVNVLHIHFGQISSGHVSSSFKNIQPHIKR